MPDAAGRLPLRLIIGTVYLPSLVYETGIGLITPVIPLLATRVGGSAAVGAAAVSLLGIGRLLCDVPAGALAARIGDRLAMLTASVVALLAMGACALAGSWGLLCGAVLLVGGTDAVFLLARQSYLTELTPPMQRARTLSTLGGVHRIGALIGPFVGAGLIHLWGLRAAFWGAVTTTALTGLIVWLSRDPATEAAGRSAPDGAPGQAHPAAASASTRAIVRRHRLMLAQLGTAVLLVGAVRATRNAALPLWSEHIGIPDSTTALVFGLSGLVDTALFYPAGRAMDRHGRSWVSVPSMALMGACLVALPFTRSVGSLAAVAMALGLANGIGAGIVMTVGADVAPPAHRQRFLGVWRLFSDSGNATGPLVLSATAAAGSLAAGIWVIAGAGFAAAAALGFWLPRWTPHANHTTRRQAGLEG
jgi:MFS family permease